MTHTKEKPYQSEPIRQPLMIELLIYSSLPRRFFQGKQPRQTCGVQDFWLSMGVLKNYDWIHYGGSILWKNYVLKVH